MSNVVYIGSARIDENGRAYGGQAGDQRNGREVSVQAWYLHEKGWRVFRATDRQKAALIGAAMAAACANDMIGYDQYDRYSLFKAAQAVGFDLSKIDTPTECDCSELVRTCCAAAGILSLPTSGFYTGNMATHLLKSGEFVELTGEQYTDQPDYLGTGDILVTRTKGHTVVVLNDGANCEGISQEITQPDTEQQTDGDTITVPSGSWRIRAGAGTQYDTVGFAHAGDTFQRVDLAGWIPVLYNNGVRFISEKMLK